MCGIAGFQDKQLQPTQRDVVISNMMDSIQHRGPDGSGKAFLDEVTFGHRRLAIIDINNGQQPMYSKDGRYCLIFNGEIYNYIELRQHLLVKGYPFQTFSDSEVLLYAYIEHGSKMLNMLNGMFAFAIYDQQEQKMFLARDHFGIKPLYFYQKNQTFIFASEIKAILQHPLVKAAVHPQTIHEYLTFQLFLGEETLFQDIHRLMPASYLVVQQGKITEQQKYWSPNYTINEEKTIDQFSDELLLLLENSLSLQIRSDVPVGAYLSGGLDSSTVAVLAAKNYFGQLKTFTGGFKDNKIYDESNYARIVSRYINSDQHEIFPTSKDFTDVFEKLVYHMDEPGGGPGLFPQYMVSKLASEHVKVVLGGQGGDEIFGGYARYAVAYLEQCLKGAIYETQEEGNHIVTLSSIIENLPMLKQYVPMMRSQFSSGLFDRMDKRYYHLVDRSPNLHQLYQKDFLAQRDVHHLFQKFATIFHTPTSPSYFNKMTYYDLNTLLPCLLQIEDRVSMAVSIESRVPLLDRRIIELAASMPPNMKFAGGKTKYMLLNSVKNVLPKAIVERKDKMGFPVPINEWMAGSLKEYILDIFNSQKAKNRGLYHVDAITNHIMKAGKFNRDIWGALNLELWHQTFIDG